MSDDNSTSPLGSLEQAETIFAPLKPLTRGKLNLVNLRLAKYNNGLIQRNIPYSDTINVEIVNIVNTCLVYTEGLQVLDRVIKQVRRELEETEKKNRYMLVTVLSTLVIGGGIALYLLWLDVPRRLRDEANAVPMINFDKGGNALLNRLDSTGKVVTYPISVKPFALDKQEVSNQNYRKCVEVGVCKAIFRNKNGENWYNDTQSRFDYPVVGLDGVAANTYCKWLGKRLPTEAEWDFAAQGDASALRGWPWGNDAPNPALANLKFDDRSDETLTLVRVTDFEQGEMKFNSLIGNAYELTSTRAEVDYATYNADSPSQLHIWDGRPPDKSFLLIARGLSFTTDMLSSPRPDITLSVEIQVDNSTRSTGFRCAKP